MKPPLVLTGIVLGWACFVILGVRSVDFGISRWKQLKEELSQKRESLRRLKGWLAVEEKVEQLRKEALGPFSQAEAQEIGWLVLQGLQQAAQRNSVSVTDLRPTFLPARLRQPSWLRVDAKVEASHASLAGFFQGISEEVPGVWLESLQIIPLDVGRMQALLRLGFSAPASSDAERAKRT